MKRNNLIQVLRNRNFRLLWFGQGTSWLGDQFRWIALPWLVLKLTHDPLALGAVLAVGSIPQAVFMLVGGATADRFSARTIMLASDLVRLVLSALLAVLTFTGNIQLWMLYIFSLVSGAVGGLFTPASGSMIPVLVHGDEIQAANSVSEGTGQLTMFIGPALAGGVIAAFGDSYSNGIAFAFVFDTVTFLASVLTLRLICFPGSLQKRADPGGHLLGSIQAGLAYAWRDPLLRSIFTTIIIFNILLGGTWAVGIPVLADSRLPEGAAAFGLLMAANAGGNLLGTVLAGNLRQFRRFTLIANFSVALFGLGFIALGLVNVTWIAFLILFVMGVGMGYVSISIITLLQRRTPKPYLGRIMSLMYFSNIGLNPFSRALAGAVVGVSLFALFGGAGVLLILLGVGLALQRGNQLLDKQIEQFGG